MSTFLLVEPGIDEHDGILSSGGLRLIKLGNVPSHVLRIVRTVG
jgi:hypothetical protein